MYESDGPLDIPCDGTAIEVKMDYGKQYEIVCVRHEYPRCSKSTLKAMKEDIKLSDVNTVCLLSECTSGEVIDYLEFIARIVEAAPTSWPAEKAEQALVVVIALLTRIKSILQPDRGSETDGKSDHHNHQPNINLWEAKELAHDLIHKLMGQWPNHKKFQDLMLSKEFCRVAILNALAVSHAEGLEHMNSSVFYEKLLNL
jgi:hypothetical protein